VRYSALLGRAALVPRRSGTRSSASSRIGVRPLARLLAPKTPADFYALLAVILMTLEMILGDKQTSQTTNIEADTVINNLVMQEAPAVPRQPGQPQSYYSSPSEPPNPAYDERVGRNKLCPCESGKKFKRCHGRSGEKRCYGPERFAP
jgi:hypothetical protein